MSQKRGGLATAWDCDRGPILANIWVPRSYGIIMHVKRHIIPQKSVVTEANLLHDALLEAGA